MRVRCIDDKGRMGIKKGDVYKVSPDHFDGGDVLVAGFWRAVRLSSPCVDYGVFEIVKKETMSKEVKALKESIAHWERWDRWAELGESHGCQHCACCVAFHRPNTCGECPLFIYQGTMCTGVTPWSKYYSDKTKENAQKMTAHLYKALAWQLEKEASEEKKGPVWDDITEEIEWESAPTPAGYSILYRYLDGREILISGGETQGGQIRVSEKYGGRIQIKSSSDAHQILLRMDK